MQFFVSVSNNKVKTFINIYSKVKLTLNCFLGTYCTEVQYLKHQIKEQNSTGCPNLSHQHSENSEEHSENLSNFAAVNLASAIKAKKPKTPVKKRSDGSNTDLGDIKRLLLQFEGGEGVHDAGNNTMETSEDDDSDWEEVEGRY